MNLQMGKLRFTFTSDVLFKMVFSRDKELLKSFVAAALSIPRDSISELTLTNPEMPPEYQGGKYCQLDLNMILDGQLLNIELQIRDMHDFRDRALYYNAKMPKCFPQL
jgi:predicted transposase/invertase (TIGR01784 family)